MHGKAVLAGLTSLTLVFASGSIFGEEHAVGAICLAPLPKNARELDRLAFSDRPARQFKYAFTVRIDDGPAVPLPSSAPSLVKSLSFAGSHRVRILDDGQPIEFFRFSFARRGGALLCLAYGPGYQTWSLEKPKPGNRQCQCVASR
jgi:hypothetical protein